MPNTSSIDINTSLTEAYSSYLYASDYGDANRLQSSFSNIKVTGAYSDYELSDIAQVNQTLSKIFFSSAIDSGLLPPGVRHISPGFVVFERPPTMQLVQYINNSVSEISSYENGECNCEDSDHEDCTPIEINPLSTYYIPVPWQLYFAFYSTSPGSEYYLTSVKMFFMNSPYNSNDVRLYSPYIPNFFTDGTLCNPMLESYEDIDRYPKNISGVVESAYDWVWNTGFNADLYECINQLFLQRSNDFVCSITKGRHMYYEGSLVNYFYDKISSVSLEEVTNMQWANPSFAQHFQADRNFISENYFNTDEIFSIFVEYYKNLLEESGQSVPKMKLSTHQEEFHNWLHHNTEALAKLPKTYSSIINHLKQHDTTFRMLDSPTPHLKSFNQFLNKLVSIM